MCSPLTDSVRSGLLIEMFYSVRCYQVWLIAPAIVGIPLQIAVFALNDYSAPFLPFFSYFIALWAIFMLEYWKRKESAIALQWGKSCKMWWLF